MIKDELTLKAVVYYSYGGADDPKVTEAEVVGLGARVLVKPPYLPCSVQIDPDNLYATRAEAWAAVIDAADRAVTRAMRILERAQAAAAT